MKLLKTIKSLCLAFLFLIPFFSVQLNADHYHHHHYHNRYYPRFGSYYNTTPVDYGDYGNPYYGSYYSPYYYDRYGYYPNYYYGPGIGVGIGNEEGGIGLGVNF